jgi:hypothetical protein
VQALGGDVDELERPSRQAVGELAHGGEPTAPRPAAYFR